jgi:hypothetical protein
VPRKRKTNLPAVPYPGAQYGQGQDQVKDLKAIPLPNQVNAQQNALDSAAQGQGNTPPAPSGPAPYSFDQALQQAQQLEPSSAIEAAGGQPVLTAGMNSGPGPSADVLNIPNQANVFKVLAQASGDANFLRLALMTRMDR